MNYSLYVESTPNPEVMKFVSNRMLVDQSIEITNIEEAKNISIAKELMKFPFIKNLYLSGNFISITKNKDVEWETIAMQLRIFISDFLNKEGIKNYTENISKEKLKEKKVEKDTLTHQDLTEKESYIISLLEEYIKPAVESDGGSITFHSFKDNIVTVDLRGACSGCPSSSSTLKMGIESLLKQKVDSNITVQANER
mgnify:CR=1 FL=1